MNWKHIEASPEEIERSMRFAEDILGRKAEKIPDKMGGRRLDRKFEDQMRGKLGEFLAAKAYGWPPPDLSVFSGHEGTDFTVNGNRISVKTIRPNAKLLMIPPGDYNFASQDYHVLCILDLDCRSGKVSKYLSEKDFGSRCTLFEKGTVFREAMSFARALVEDENSSRPFPVPHRSNIGNRSKFIQQDNFVVHKDAFDRYGVEEIPASA